jgi:hypothetical protein
VAVLGTPRGAKEAKKSLILSLDVSVEVLDLENPCMLVNDLRFHTFCYLGAWEISFTAFHLSPHFSEFSPSHQPLYLSFSFPCFPRLIPPLLQRRVIHSSTTHIKTSTLLFPSLPSYLSGDVDPLLNWSWAILHINIRYLHPACSRQSRHLRGHPTNSPCYSHSHCRWCYWSAAELHPKGQPCRWLVPRRRSSLREQSRNRADQDK